MIKTKPIVLKQLALCVWIWLTLFVWFTVNLSESTILHAPPFISEPMIKTRNFVWPYIYRQYIFAEKNSKSGK
jgi:hypothetical protein